MEVKTKQNKTKKKKKKKKRAKTKTTDTVIADRAGIQAQMGLFVLFLNFFFLFLSFFLLNKNNISTLSIAGSGPIKDLK